MKTKIRIQSQIQIQNLFCIIVFIYLPIHKRLTRFGSKLNFKFVFALYIYNMYVYVNFIDF